MTFCWNSKLTVEFISCWKFEFQNQPKNLAIFILVNEPVKITYIIGIRDFFFNLYPCQGKINQGQIQWWSLSLNSSLGQKFVKFSHFPFFCIKPRKLKNMKKFNLISGSESKENYFKSFNSRAKIIIYIPRLYQLLLIANHQIPNLVLDILDNHTCCWFVRLHTDSPSNQCLLL